MIAAALGPTPFWYAARGSGYTALVLLTLSVLLGLITSVRWVSDRWPRFLSQSLHRNISLLALCFLVVHIGASIIDPFAGLNLRDAIVPAGAGYRPVWIALGVVSAELFVAVLITSLLRHRMSFGVWRAVHLLAYATWPIAVLHGIGTGTDTKAVWAILVVVACVGAVVVTLIWRLASGWPAHAWLRALGMAVSLAAVTALTAWTASGPLQPGWARAAGTPANLLSGGSGSTPAASPSPGALAAGLNDPLTGSIDRGATAVTARLTDRRDTSLTLVIAAAQDGSGTLVAARSGQTVCSAPASFGDTVTAQCGSVVVSVSLADDGRGGLTGTLVTRAAGQ
ncbi:MAG: ferric reductase-like transmembrane domain-containing protein [Candidatus Dormibacteraeota bacterium]|nr:ferric reductase-like transmembrane domain-containing protein [Candidatus Dormibacteraeota bacterium]MBV9525928.1 ferric reductase-like transmembrane domain-containing protein [Candidatus Dormibacteraeota bacterium]